MLQSRIIALSDPRVTQVTDSDPKIGINQLVNSHVEQTGKLGSLGSLGSLPVDGAPTDAGDDYDEVVI